MVYTPRRWFMIYQIYAVQCPYAWHRKIRCANFFDHKNSKKEELLFYEKYLYSWAPGAHGPRDRLLTIKPFSSKSAIGFVSATYSKEKSSLYQIFDWVLSFFLRIYTINLRFFSKIKTAIILVWFCKNE